MLCCLEKPLSLSFYQRSDVVQIARELLGKGLFTRDEKGLLTGGLIIETEAYAGIDDKASHAYSHRRTQRTEVMYGPGGNAYVYLCYGIHCLLNAVTHEEGVPHAVLIRAMVPTHGIEEMVKRRKKKTLDKTIASGPGALCQALGIHLGHYGMPLTSSTLWIADCGIKVGDSEIEVTPRIGVDYAGVDAKLPYRFCWKPSNSTFASGVLPCN